MKEIWIKTQEVTENFNLQLTHPSIHLTFSARSNRWYAIFLGESSKMMIVFKMNMWALLISFHYRLQVFAMKRNYSKTIFGWPALAKDKHYLGLKISNSSFKYKASSENFMFRILVTKKRFRKFSSIRLRILPIRRHRHQWVVNASKAKLSVTNEERRSGSPHRTS